MESKSMICKGKELGGIRWAEGYHVYYPLSKSHYIINGALQVPVLPDTVSLFTGKCDTKKNRLFAGDVVKSIFSDVVMVIRFGDYPSFCPADKQPCNAVGFYAECLNYEDCPLMPLGEPSTYAELLGNIYDNPEFK